MGPRLPAGRFQIGFFHRHGLEVFGRQRRVRFSNGFSEQMANRWRTTPCEKQGFVTSKSRLRRLGQPTGLRAWTLTTVLCPLQVLADALHRHGAFGDRARHSFHRARPDVAGSK